MSKTAKYIILGLVVLSVVALFVFNENVSVGAVIAGITALIAAVKSRLVHNEPLSQRIDTIEGEHSVKREEWNRTKDEYDSRFRAMKARMDYLDYTSRKISEQISDLDVAEQKVLDTNSQLSDDEILERLNNL